MSQTVRKKFKYRHGGTEVITLSHKCWKDIKIIRNKTNRTYHKQKMNNITDYDADESYSKVMPW
jgi:hypothetical protein